MTANANATTASVAADPKDKSYFDNIEYISQGLTKPDDAKSIGGC